VYLVGVAHVAGMLYCLQRHDWQACRNGISIKKMLMEKLKCSELDLLVIKNVEDTVTSIIVSLRLLFACGWFCCTFTCTLGLTCKCLETLGSALLQA